MTEMIKGAVPSGMAALKGATPGAKTGLLLFKMRCSMSAVTAEMVKSLREKTGAGMMDCKIGRAHV